MSKPTVTRHTPWDELPDLLTLREACAKLGCGRTWAQDQAAAGLFPGARKLAGKWMVSKWELMAYVGVPEEARSARKPATQQATTWIKQIA